MTESASVGSRLLSAARAVFVWSGLLVLAVVGIVASANLGLSLVRALGDMTDRWVILGLLGVVAGSVAAAVLLFAAWWFAGRTERALRLTVIGGFVLVAAGRLAIAIAHNSHMTGESRNFDVAARSILSGAWDFNGRGPGYPLVLGGAYAIFGAGPTAGELLNLVFGLVGAGALFALLRARAGPRPAVLGLYLFALWPAGALISNVRLSETMYIALILLAAYGALAGTGVRSASVTGALLAAAQYIRPTTLVLLPAYMIARWWPHTSWRAAIVRTALPMIVTAILLLIPLIAYNQQLYGHPSVASTLFGGSNLYVGTDELTGGRWTPALQAEIDALTPGGLLADSDAAGVLATQRLLGDPLLPLRMAPAKFDTLWGSEGFGVAYAMSVRTLTHALGTFPALASNLFYTFVVLGALIVAFVRRHDLDRLTVLSLGLVLAVSLIHFLYEVRDRYHAYVTPLLICVTAIGMAQWLASRTSDRQPVATAAS